jgi:predicted component of viral defense system (DUF524 family)
MASRLKLQEELEEILGSRNVYFQPPESVKMKYDAIVYNLSDIRTDYANDKVYKKDRSYEVTVISRNPDNEIAENLLDHFKYISFDRRFINDNLYHDALTLFY